MFEPGYPLATVTEPVAGAPHPAALTRSDDPRWRVSSAHAVTFAATVAALGLILLRARYRPMWDGFVYATEINDAASQPFDHGALRLAGHASQAYAILAIGLQRLALGSTWPLFVLSVVLLGAAVTGFVRLISHVLPGRELALERALATAVFVLQPTLLAAVMQPGLDFPLIPAFVWTIALLIERRYAWVILVGVALCFTKETGVLLYGALIASYVAWRLIGSSGAWRANLMAVLRLWPLLTPALLFGVYLLVRSRAVAAGEPVVWNAGTAMIGQSLLRQLLVPRIDRYLASYLTIALILNFGWLATATVAGAAFMRGRRLWRVGWRGAWLETARMTSTATGLAIFIAICAGYLLTRFATYANSRYLLPLIALRDVVFVVSLLALPVGVWARRAVLFVYAALLFVSTVRTADPLSRALYGTFAFGEHGMLRMTRITHECCGAGRDQLVYNLQFTTLEALTNDALTGIRPGDSTMIVIPDSTNWFVARRLDRTTGERTTSPVNSVAPLVVESDSAALYVGRKPRVVFIALPNASLAGAMAQLETAFTLGPERRFRRGGYWVSTYELSERRPRGGARAEVP